MAAFTAFAHRHRPRLALAIHALFVEAHASALDTHVGDRQVMNGSGGVGHGGGSSRRRYARAVPRRKAADRAGPRRPRAHNGLARLSLPLAADSVRTPADPAEELLVWEQHFLDELSSYIGFSPENAESLRHAGPYVQPKFKGIVDRFYEAIFAHPRVAAVLTGGQPQIERQKALLTDWMAGLFSGVYDAEYIR